MSNLTRRRFLTNTSMGVAGLAGGVAAAGALVESVKQAAEPPALLPTGDQLVAHVRSISAGEITLLAGTTEVALRDQALAQRLAKAAAGARR